MHIDSKILTIIAEHIGLNSLETSLFIENHKSSEIEMVIMKILNYYAEKNSEEKRIELEKAMSRAAKEGRVEDQKKILDVIKDTMIRYPELAERIRKQQSELNAKLIFDFLAKANSEAQVELLTHMLHMQKQAKQVKAKLDEVGD